MARITQAVGGAVGGAAAQDASEVARIAQAYLVFARDDPYRALTTAITDALVDLDEAAVALRERERWISKGLVRAAPPAPTR